MAQIPTPPASRPGSETPDAELKEAPVADSSADLLQSLDTLLEKYLDLLDRHQKSQEELARRISSGFFSLAQANYTCPPGRRYGTDYYDERMKATRRVALQPPPDSQSQEQTTEVEDSTGNPETKAIFAIEPVANENSEALSETKESESSKSDDSPKEAPDANAEDTEPTESTEDTDADSTSAPKPEPVKKKPCSSDPIRWFGVLVSPHLRNAQKSFSDVIDGPVPQLASTAFEMRALESEISRVRSQIGQA
ncbi:hypothetical protein P170DRAFT_472283 [Aspergillus steynii IBT 23096]|uniref:Vacuolar ATPase assembly protein VMA22 n=1 Tax=Aspergillus steynii IBT 23096 TaxID=1392250 RepID=A0A2I2GHM5_9EURO|nr:uncharacterized protein P170DRAFT_472283 [Aspergillus steynii IBT 23096]PLB52386.1 hypothetical protein P170DRAFT_472283 [Aspergillus steynii IBT 23096]